MLVNKDPMFRFLSVLTVLSIVGLQTWRTLFNNFAVEVAHLEGSHIGMIQSFREIPGFFGLNSKTEMLFRLIKRILPAHDAGGW